MRHAARSVVMVLDTKPNVMMVILPMAMVAAVNVLSRQDGVVLMVQPSRNQNVLNIFLKKVFLLVKVLSIWETELSRVSEHHTFPNA